MPTQDRTASDAVLGHDKRTSTVHTATKVSPFVNHGFGIASSFCRSSRDRPEVESIEVVVNRGDGHCFVGALHDDLEIRAQVRVEGEFAHELTFGRKLDQLARLVRIER